MSVAQPAAAPIALLTDFGLADWYVASVKGVLATRAPGVPLVDVTHEIAPGDVRQAAFVLEQAWRWFPPETVFLVVVDPGVGTARRALAVRAEERSLVGPDNGVLEPALASGAEVREIDPARVEAGAVSRTFHGRDLFAPAAAYLARGGAFESLGARVADPLRLVREPPVADTDSLVGHVVHVDRFGNCITDVTEAELSQLLAGRDPILLRAQAGSVRIDGLTETYGDSPPGIPSLLLGSTGRLEIAIRDQRAASHLGLRPGDPVHLRVRAGKAKS